MISVFLLSMEAGIFIWTLMIRSVHFWYN